MATFFLDLEGGSDAADGTTFANRWLTLTSGATAARIAPGDTIRLMAAPNETSLGQNATWTNNSKSVTLTTAVTANIDDGELAWTASANVISTADTSQFKENTKSAKQSIAAAFTTGLAAFKATGALNLSGYQQVSFWLFNSVAVAASTLSLRLCTDVAGATSVHTIAIPAIASANLWVPVTIDLGANMNAAIQSVALYQDVDIAAVDIYIDNIIACKASSSADALTLTSLIGKVWNLCWVASASYAANDIRKPTQPNRNGFRYKVTAGGGGAAGSTEPTWPQEVGATVVDGALTWTCDDLEETWYCPQSINGSTVKIDNATATLGSAGRGYSGTTETVATYKREPIKLAINTGQTAQKSGTGANRITYSGGWDRTSMAAQNGETWVTGQNGANVQLFSIPNNFVTFFNINAVHGGFGIQITGLAAVINSCHHNHHSTMGVYATSITGIMRTRGVVANNNKTHGIANETYGNWLIAERMTLSNNINDGGRGGVGTGYPFRVNASVARMRNNGNYGYNLGFDGFAFEGSGIITSGNGTGSIGAGWISLSNSTLGEGMPIPNSLSYACDRYNVSQKDNQIIDNHVLTTDGGTIISATDQRHTASGISWKFRPTNSSRNSTYPLRLSVAKIACLANTALNIAIWTRRDNTNINGTLKVAGGQLSGIGADVSVACAPAINTWVQSGTLTVTPTEAGVIEVTFEVYDGVGTINNFWVDDLSVA